MRWAAYASIGAGLIHGAAIGLHADHPTLSRIFLAMAAAQVAWGVVAITLSTWSVVAIGSVLNISAVGGWVLTRTTGISFINGLEIAESPQPADTLCAALAALSLIAIVWAYVRRDVPASSHLGINAAYVCAAVTLVAAWSVTGNPHLHGELATVDGGLAIDARGVIVAPSTEMTVVLDGDVESAGSDVDGENAEGASTTIATAVPTTNPKQKTTSTTIAPTTTLHGHVISSDQAKAAASGWPRAFNPAVPVNLSGIQGFTQEQGQRALALISNSQRDLPAYSSYQSALAAGYVSIGDADTGFEHLIKYSLLNDGRFLDTKAPESLVYQVSGATKTLVSAMFIASAGMASNDITLTSYAGGLIQWHTHNNLCWRNVNGVPKVMGVVDAAGICPAGSVLQTNGAPMVHVWITPHACGPFAALEGDGAGIADEPDSVRVDKCNAGH
jgi:hypothetical protein